ncbi:sensor histidine kinase [Saccharopolyspora griseoalba]|uniref:Sensor histidine kinase n=1 Tax=Saccharopolyspora griseoalba TaxID=1431848 RepID=A0ABW2LD85_9PSEU
MSGQRTRRIGAVAVVLLLMLWSLLLVWHDEPTGGAFIGGYLVAGVAALWLPMPGSLVLTAPYLVALYFAQTAGSQRSPGSVLLIEVGALACFLIGVYVRGGRAEGQPAVHAEHAPPEPGEADESDGAPASPDQLPVIAAEFERDTAIPCTVAVSGAGELSAEAGRTVHRVVQRALVEVRSHARPQRVRIGLEHRPAGTRLIVRDHGHLPGRPDEEALRELRDDTERLGGTLAATSTDDGTRVELWLPR